MLYFGLDIVYGNRRVFAAAEPAAAIIPIHRSVDTMLNASMVF